ncbi:DHA1 family bicyclomycin/chloramphenicol resistance-like MFS transporter [Palleronia aestuarii]|uniref:Bcr/CflA family efflux transporter n=1 Tax=Palleronia aestuarii TaxID=568105 RepID=A0A2W7N7E8_9RHOB|nr:multidrug effflux MFS transporter [Palleronia aestuarii]PZX16305.1 DHA1 family bicyclomycin/chloramphenicol resistance-like MFS transporter [Palleronia aestuarii]
MTNFSPVRFLDSRTPPHIATLILVTSLSALSMNLFLPSLPNMTTFFETDYGIVQISVAGYLFVNAAMQLIIGPVSDRYGRRAVLLTCIVIFILASFACAVATNIWVFLFFRMVQASIVAGIVLPRAAIRDLFSSDRAASMIGWVTMGMSVAPMIAPAFGGILDGFFGWQANFVTLGLLGIGALALVWFDMGETAERSTGNMREQIAQYPQLLKSRRFWGYAATSAFASGAFFAYLGGAPYVGSEVFGLTPSALGIHFGMPAIGYMIGNGISGRYSARIGLQRMLVWGTIINAAGLVAAVLVFYSGLASAVLFFGFMTFVGLGNGLVMPNATAGMLSVKPHLAGTASGLGGAILIATGAVLSAVAGFILSGSASALPLLELMAGSALLAVVTIALTIRREARLAAAGAPAE